MSLEDWANGTIGAMHQYVNVREMTGDDWQSWGMLFFSSPQLGILAPPNPYEFTSWVDWAERLQDALRGASGASGSGVAGNAGATQFFLVTQLHQPLTTQSGQYLATN
jgi:hypothetical protein